MTPPRIVAIISSFNEGDIIGPVIEHLVENGVDVYLIDNLSTDDTVEQAKQFLGRGLIGIETFPPDPPTEVDPAELPYDWTGILMRKEELACELDADWFIHHDADEFRETPWPGMSLADGIRWVDTLGFNAISFRLLNFRPLDERFKPGMDPRSTLLYYEEGKVFDQLQTKCWKKTGQPIALAPSGGHDVTFHERRIFPIRFLLRHYPIRSEQHGKRKVLKERKPRFRPQELARGWHVQYDDIDEGNLFELTTDIRHLLPYSADHVRLETLLEGREGRDALMQEGLRKPLQSTDASRELEEGLARQSGSAGGLREEFERKRAGLSETERHFKETIATLEVERDRARAVLQETTGRVQTELERQRAEAAVRAGLESRLQSAEQDLERTRKIRDGFEERNAALEGHLHHARSYVLTLQKEIVRIQNSRLWRLGSAYWWLLRKLRLLPPFGSDGNTSYVPAISFPATTASQHASPHSETKASALARLEPRRPSAEATNLHRIFEELTSDLGTGASLLDWQTGLHLVDCLPGIVAFEPRPDEEILPYLGSTVDVVAIPGSKPGRLAEAARVASTAVLIFDERTGRVEVVAERNQRVREWSASILIPVFNHLSHTTNCLTAIEKTLPAGFTGEIIVIDDASTDDTWPFLERWASEAQGRIVLRNEANRGYLESCNRAASVATKDVLVFLNNDTIPKAGWLEALLQTFEDYPRAGAVGGQLRYPDERLQEAGGCIFSDASGMNFGRNDPDPNAPLYSFVREVDYCSGALLATPRSLFEQGGGFDTRFRPAYYEDTDYCFSVRERGYKVYYQPASVVIHVEGASSGTDLTTGVKRYQVENRVRFAEKWDERLRQQPAPPERIDAATLHRLAFPPGRARILVINHTVPEYDRESGSKRLFDLIRILRAEGHSVCFMAPWVPGGDRYIRELEQIGVATFRKGLEPLEEGPFPRVADRLIALGDFDMALICFWHIAEEWMPVIRTLSPRTKVVVDSVDLHFLRASRERLRPSTPIEQRVLDHGFADQMRGELNVYAGADRVLTVSSKEAGIINDFLSRPLHARTVPDVEALEQSKIPFEGRRGLVFIGSFRHPPNVEAARWLLEDIIPLLPSGLQERHPLYVVGTDLNDSIRRLGQRLPNVHMVGWAPSVTPYLARARVSLLPLLNGAGTKRKLIQASLIGTPSVATQIAIEGLGLRNEQETLIAGSARDFATAIERLCEDEQLWVRLAAAARKRMLDVHGFETGRRSLAEAMQDLLPVDASQPSPQCQDVRT